MPLDSERLQARRLTTARVAERFDVVSRTVERWERDRRLGFPQPLKIHGRKYWKLSDLEDWERTRAAGLAIALELGGDA
jgi:hypothetical protein